MLPKIKTIIDKCVFVAILLGMDILRIHSIGRPRDPITAQDAAIGVGVSALLIMFILIPPVDDDNEKD